MMKITVHTLTLCLAVSVLVTGCSSSRKTLTKDDQQIEIRLVQVNDVYEIAPLNNGTEGGLARIATLKKHQLAENPNTLLLMAGDFLSPSVFNSL